MRSMLALALAVCLGLACSRSSGGGGDSGESSGGNGAGGAPGSGGSEPPVSDASGSGGKGGGIGSEGGASGRGGTPGSGGAQVNGGTTGSGGATVKGGAVGSGGAPVKGGAPGTGGSTGTAAGSGGATTVAGTGGVATTGALVDRISVSAVTAPAAVKPGRNNYRIWGSSSLGISPVFTAPLANCETLVCITAGTADSRSTPGTSHAYVLRLDASDALKATHDLGAFECRGLAAEPDGHFGALLWAAGTSTSCADVSNSGHIYIQRFDATGAPAGAATELANATGSDVNCPTDWGIGESRLEFGATSYGAYYHVHSASGHEGDTLKYVDLAGKETTQWDWGCSHSMSNLLRWNGSDKKFMPACVTDCYPGTTGSDLATSSIGGVYINNKNKVISVDGGCNGDVAGELGGAAPAPTGWKIVFNAHQAAATPGQSSYSSSTMNQDIGFASIAAGLTSSSVVWLSTTPGNEADSGIARWSPSGDPAEQYIVGWSEPGSTYKYKLARVDAAGAFLEGPVDVSTKVKWGRRDDPFRTHANGDVVWAWFDAASTTTMRLARVCAGSTHTCASF